MDLGAISSMDHIFASDIIPSNRFWYCLCSIQINNNKQQTTNNKQQTTKQTNE
jgi:hypothetical protein